MQFGLLLKSAVPTNVPCLVKNSSLDIIPYSKCTHCQMLHRLRLCFTNETLRFKSNIMALGKTGNDLLLIHYSLCNCSFLCSLQYCTHLFKAPMQRKSFTLSSPPIPPSSPGTGSLTNQRESVEQRLRRSLTESVSVNTGHWDTLFNILDQLMQVDSHCGGAGGGSEFIKTHHLGPGTC